MMDKFTAIDFETARPERWSICQVGLVRVESGTRKESLSILVRPPSNSYGPFFTGLHGIGPGQTEDAPTFDAAWPQIEPFISGQNVVAHNGFGFDFPVLAKTLEHYGMEAPDFTGHCTYNIFGESLAILCQKHGIPLNHHDALSDAMACAELYQIHLNKKKNEQT